MKRFDISDSDFEAIRQNGKYYVDKTMLIQEFVERNERITLITRPRRFGKTTAMTMLADFFDMEKDSRERFKGLRIMDTEYAGLINSRPVIFLSFKECDGSSAENLRLLMNSNICNAMIHLKRTAYRKMDSESETVQKFLILLEKLKDDSAGYHDIANSLDLMIRICFECCQVKPLVLIDEYDQPLLASYTYGYHEEVRDFLSAFYTKALKDNPLIYRAVMTGIQRMAKESIFSKFNNPAVYTVMDSPYHSCFGFTEKETEEVLKAAGLELDEPVKEMYDGYQFAGLNIYNPSSVMGYAQNRKLKSYWTNTSSNRLIHESVASARKDDVFRIKYEKLLENGSVQVSAATETSYMELAKPSTLWGLLINAGYLTVTEEMMGSRVTVRIPNKEVGQEFMQMISEELELESDTLGLLFTCLEKRDMETFLDLYREIILTSTSYYDGKENAYHMFFLGMCVFLHGRYKVTSNLESGLGRHDIMLEPVKAGLEPVIVEFKQINADEKKADLADKSKEALQQIKDLKYYAPLHGNILLVGIAHQGKRCEMVYEILVN